MPKTAAPTGESLEIRPLKGSASTVPTIVADNLYLVDNEFEGNKLLQSTESGDIVEATTVTMKVTFSDGTTADYKIGQ